MQKVRLQKTGSGQLYTPIPRFIEDHFGLMPKQEVWVDIEGEKIVIYLSKPERPPAQPVEHAHGRDKKETVAKEA